MLSQQSAQQSDVRAPAQTLLEGGEVLEVLGTPRSARLDRLSEGRQHLGRQLDPSPGQGFPQDLLEGIRGRGPVLLAVDVQHQGEQDLGAALEQDVRMARRQDLLAELHDQGIVGFEHDPLVPQDARRVVRPDRGGDRLNQATPLHFLPRKLEELRAQRQEGFLRHEARRHVTNLVLGHLAEEVEGENISPGERDEVIGEEGPKEIFGKAEQRLDQRPGPHLAIRRLLDQTVDHPRRRVEAIGAGGAHVLKPGDQGSPVIGEVREPGLDQAYDRLDEQVHGVSPALESPPVGVADVGVGLGLLPTTRGADSHPQNSARGQVAAGSAELPELAARHVQKLEERLELPLLDGGVDLELPDPAGSPGRTGKPPARARRCGCPALPRRSGRAPHEGES